ncbi:hypothetical protein HYH03_016483 [Edaphochlamys debaryana]|uniref:Probable ubiquitin carboxyl-terminal hydrolase MINDY-4 n=1 Tax=Edaphochlamys debaryana TaxID=47281 RepID=A0A836BPW1_9CHLO|nr:hypothetical protein HYH03_016483 [Edaphochlamys debaryana]|eukprot:KAG2484736.1 hypothetical protein HYH03_016483 [Edaphochlamys debaryana]
MVNTLQVDVAEALIREYLVREGCSQALEAFNREKPKTPSSITKREVLRKTLGLDRAAAWFKKQNPEGTPSTLEVWVAYQIAKVNAPADSPSSMPQPAAARPLAARPADGRSSSSAAPAASSAAPPRPGPPRQGFAVEAPRPTAAASPAARRPSAPSATRDDDDDEPEIVHSTPIHATGRSSHSGMTHAASTSALGSAPGSHPRSASTSGAPSPARGPGASSVLGSRPTAGSHASPATASAPASRAGSGAVGPGGAGGLASTAPQRPAASARPAGGRPASAGVRGGELVMEEMDEFEDDGPSAGMANLRLGGAPVRKAGAPIPPDAMRAVRLLLWGKHGQPPPSWKQGFYFCRHPGLQFGLVQRQGGPCGVLAGVQAHILVSLYSLSSGFNLTPRQPEQHSALTAALVEILWAARPSASAPACLALPDGGDGGGAKEAARQGYDVLTRALTQHTAANREALTDLVRYGLPVLMAEDGWGVVLLVLSLALTKTVAGTQADMDEPANSLMGMHGYCTQELVNLIMMGSAVSNVFDGNQQLDGATTLKGISRKSKMGLLTLFEWYKYVEVGPTLKNPPLPVWVVCSESHFTVLFAQDGRALKGALPFDLFYYDELANQESLIKLSVSKCPKGGWTARCGSTVGDRGKCEGLNIPPLECVIETRWPGVKVDWNGDEPIL